MPLVWLSRTYGHPDAGRVYGPDLMLALCDRGQSQGLRHFFYGGLSGVAERLAQRLKARSPALLVAGTHSPPFRARRMPTSCIRSTLPARISCGSALAPRSRTTVARHRSLLQAPVLIAIGAAFNFTPGAAPGAGVDAAERARVGLPARARAERLAYRYLVYNPQFVFKIAMQLSGRQPQSLR